MIKIDTLVHDVTGHGVIYEVTETGYWVEVKE